jgi:hypothetical protein
VSRKTSNSSGKRDKKKSPQRIDLDHEQTQAILERVKTALGEGDYKIIKAAFETIAFLMRLVETKNTSMKRLQQILFGWRTEKTKKVLKKKDKSKPSPDAASDKDEKTSEQENNENNPDKKKKPKSKGHGRNGADAYTAADKVKVSNSDLKPGDPCPVCPKGKVYPLADPARIVRIVGQAPLGATVYELERLRCNPCGEVFTAAPPQELNPAKPSEPENTDGPRKKAKVAKYSESAGSMIANLKYGSGMPWYRAGKLQENLGVPLPASTQWDIVEKVADRIHAVFTALKQEAAQGDVIHNDDMVMKNLELMKAQAEQLEQGKPDRSGMFTSNILSIKDGRKIALFYSSANHAGENLDALLEQRDKDRGPPIQMCDALSRNAPKTFQTLMANCLSHGRRKFVEVHWAFPEECRYVLEILKEVYINDDIARQEEMSAEERLEFHKEKSGPFMDKLHTWLKRQIDEKEVEPNSSIGQSITYLLNHWPELTLFLRVPKAPLDNNICEQAIKRAIMHRKNSLFYKTLHGAYIGDLFMSLIHTCYLNGVNAFEYITILQKHSCELFKNPEKWLPWNYEETLLASAS